MKLFNFYVLISILFLNQTAYADDDVQIKVGSFTSYLKWKDMSMKTDEKVFMIMHVIDVMQTVNFGNEPCYQEVDPISRRVIGKHPNPGQVILWGMAQATISHYGFQLVDNSNLPKWSKTTLKWTYNAIKFDTIHNNWQIGINIYGSNDHYKAGKGTVECVNQHKGYYD